MLTLTLCADTLHFWLQLCLAAKLVGVCFARGGACSAARMPGQGSRPRFSKAQWHQIACRLINRKTGDTFNSICAELTATLGRTVSTRTLRNARHRFNKHGRMHGKPGPPKGQGGAPRYMHVQLPSVGTGSSSSVLPMAMYRVLHVRSSHACMCICGHTCV